MTDFVFSTLTNDPLAQIESAALGVSTSTKLTDNDIGKAVKLAANQNFVLCGANDEIDGFLNTVEPFTVNGGFAFGGVQRNRRVQATVGANQGATPMAIGDLVVSDVQTGINTVGGAKVKTGTPTTNLWRCLRIISGTGAATSVVLLERV